MQIVCFKKFTCVTEMEVFLPLRLAVLGYHINLWPKSSLTNLLLYASSFPQTWNRFCLGFFVVVFYWLISKLHSFGGIEQQAKRISCVLSCITSQFSQLKVLTCLILQRSHSICVITTTIFPIPYPFLAIVSELWRGILQVISQLNTMLFSGFCSFILFSIILKDIFVHLHLKKKKITIVVNKDDYSNTCIKLVLLLTWLRNRVKTMISAICRDHWCV